LGKDRTLNSIDIQDGFVRFLFGFFKKAYIADTLALYLVNPVFSEPSNYTTGTLWIAMMAYSVQIYTDFSGYTNMAIGSAKLLGIQLPENFIFPYLSTNISEFWRRWHITMSTFFRDYVYIPMGGNRVGSVRRQFNLMITTSLSGLWHGASWNFVLWGMIHGALLIIRHMKINNIPNSFIIKNRLVQIVHIAICWLVTLTVVSIAWVFFRITQIEEIGSYLLGLVTSSGTEIVQITPLIIFCFVFFVIDHLDGLLKGKCSKLFNKTHPIPQAMIYAVIIIFLFYNIPEKKAQFIYMIF
jgi:alginate O-acetyltransferase complex protein AlgI